MAEQTEKEAEKVETDEEAEAKAMSASFNDEPPPEEETAKPVETEEPKELDKEEPKESEPTEPEFVQLTKKDHDAIMATINKIASLDKGLSSVAGTMGGIQQTLQRLQSETPAGEPVVVSDEDVAEFAADFPELGGRLKTTLQRIADRMNVKGTAKGPAFDEEAAGKFFTTREEIRELALLDGLVPDWKEVVGKHGDAENPYRKWLASKDEGYRNLIENTPLAVLTAESIKLFKQETAPKPEPKAPKETPKEPPKETPQAAARRARIASAVTPKGTAQTPLPSEKSEEEAMREAFNST